MKIAFRLAPAAWLFSICIITAAHAGGVPHDVLALMPPRGISLHSTIQRIGPGGSPILLHLYVVPAKGAHPIGASGPIKREDVGPGSSIPDSPFFLDLFARRNNRWRRLNSIRFKESGDTQLLEIRWLQPRARRVPIVLMRFGVGDSGAYMLFTFSKGLAADPVIQGIDFDTSSESSSWPEFDRTDKRGYLTVVEHWSETRKGKDFSGVRIHRWNGARFTRMDF